MFVYRRYTLDNQSKLFPDVEPMTILFLKGTLPQEERLIKSSFFYTWNNWTEHIWSFASRFLDPILCSPLAWLCCWYLSPLQLQASPGILSWVIEEVTRLELPYPPLPSHLLEPCFLHCSHLGRLPAWSLNNHRKSRRLFPGKPN